MQVYACHNGIFYFIFYISLFKFWKIMVGGGVKQTIKNMALLLYHYIHTLYIYIKYKYTGIVFWSIIKVYLRNLHIHIHHLPDLKEWINKTRPKKSTLYTDNQEDPWLLLWLEHWCCISHSIPRAVLLLFLQWSDLLQSALFLWISLFRSHTAVPSTPKC